MSGWVEFQAGWAWLAVAQLTEIVLRRAASVLTQTHLQIEQYNIHACIYWL